MSLENGRILYVSQCDLSLINGPGVNEREFIQAMTKRFPSTFHVLVPKPVHDIPEFGPNTTYSQPHGYYDPLLFPRHVRSQVRLASQLIESGRFDFLVFRLNLLPIAENIITRRYPIPFAVKTLGVGTFEALKEQSGIRGVVGRAIAPFSRRITDDLLSRASAIDVCTIAHREHYIERYGLNPERVHYIDNAANTERFRPEDTVTARTALGLSWFDPIVGYIGGRPWERGGKQMIEAAPALLRKFPKMGFVIAGGGDGMDGLKRRAEELGVASHCIFPGVVPYESAPRYINAFDICLSFDRKDRTDRIGNSSQKVRQYLACGKPVVSGPGGNRFLVEEQLGTIVDGSDFPGVANAIEFWLRKPEAARAANSERAVRYARQYLSFDRALDERLEVWSRQVNTSRQEHRRLEQQPALT